MANWINIHSFETWLLIMIVIVVSGLIYAQWESRNDNHPS